MIIPINKSLMQRIYQFISRFKATAFERQRTKLFPPRLNQVQPTSILGNELYPQFGPSSQRQSGLSTLMNSKVVFNNQPTIGRKLADNLFQELNVAGAISTRAYQDRCLSGSWFKRSMNPHFAAATIIRFESSSSWSQFPFFTRVGLDSYWTHFINTDDSCSRRRCHISLDYAPLFSTNSGSCFSASWNQLCCRFHLNPSSSIQVQMVESDKWVPCRSRKAVCSRSSVHNSKGYPSDRGFCKARLIKAPRTSWLWTGFRPGRGLSSNPDNPSSLNRLTHMGPIALLLNPASWPASEAVRSGLAARALMIRTRWTRLIGSVREETIRSISSLSSIVKALNRIRFGISSSQFSVRGLYLNY
jgi:hypothetical protein